MPTALPSLADTIVVVVLLLPGFVCLIVLRRIAILETPLSDFETTVWSLGISALIYGVFSLATGISNMDQLRDMLFQQSYLIPFLVTFVLVFSIIVSCGLIVRIRRGGENVAFGDCWDWLKDLGNPWVTVYTTDGLEYRGQVFGVGYGRSRHEVVVKDPKQIVRSNDWKATAQIPRGQLMFFTQDDIRRVAVYVNEKDPLLRSTDA